MAGPSLRLLHAARCQLDVPLTGLPTVPRDAVELIASATLTAWERLIDAACTHDVDALLLTGDTFDASAGSLAADVALRTGCEKLAEKKIPLLITPGSLDPHDAWTDLPPLPGSVTVFDSAWDAPVEIQHQGHTVAVVQPVSYDTDVPPPELGRLKSNKKPQGAAPVQVGLLWTGSDDGSTRTAARSAPAAYASLDLLLGPSDADRDLRPLSEGTLWLQAAPQAITPVETGPQGARLIECDAQRRFTNRVLLLGPVRRERLSARLDHARHKDDLLDRMLSQLEELPVMAGEQCRVIDWEFVGSPEAFSRLRWDDDAAVQAAEALQELTDQPGKLRYLHRSLPLWQLPVDPASQGELWRDYLQLLEHRATLTTEELRRLAIELRPQHAVAQGAWERWTAQLDPQQIAERARLYGRRWFAEVSS
jgi:DNA repair protein SbcD/Mre11